MSRFHDFTMASLEGEQVSFSDFADQACLIVNVASARGLTPQYAGLRTLHHDDNGVRVLGFPCNQFGEQEPGSAEEIRSFVTENYDIDFPMFAKIEVNGDGATELYQWLKSEQPGEGETSDITWNFEKFLVNSNGDVVARFTPFTTPEEVAEQLGELLG